ncbi:hypothetical protein PP654_gp104 [Bacillus phage v_B-Bak10]|uniref:Uncharacterized protein n=1 Tax=Bacillus phage v_B-Bak10 TaxID=2094736 RepID=A0A385IK34_9CAUD|nr:hypothetical protein PP654_gp104 [Bacillus phage v_B-Bak10]AXY83230.1 hypothetical protein vBBBak10_038 [Bacillus phage v_B-Bak10]
MLSYMHEDIYVYVDNLITEEYKKTGDNVSFDDNWYFVRKGRLKITLGGVVTTLTVKINESNAIFNFAGKAGDILDLNFENMVFKLNGKLIFLSSYNAPANTEVVKISLSFGTGSHQFSYFGLKEVRNDSDINFCTSLDYNYSTEKLKRSLVNSETIDVGIAKPEYSWSINGLWNNEEASKFGELFNLRFIDEEAKPMVRLIGCTTDSFKNGSSDSGDLTYSLSGKFKKIM